MLGLGFEYGFHTQNLYETQTQKKLKKRSSHTFTPTKFGYGLFVSYPHFLGYVYEI